MSVWYDDPLYQEESPGWYRAWVEWHEKQEAEQ